LKKGERSGSTRVKPWGTHWAFLFTSLATGLYLAVQFLVTRLMAYHPMPNGPCLLLLNLPPLASTLLTVFFTGKWKSLSWQQSLNYLGFKRPDARQALGALLAVLPLFAGYFLAFQAYRRAGIYVGLYPEWPFLALYFFINAGLYEEMLFRGLLFQSLRTGRSFLIAASLAALLWVADHWLGFFPGLQGRVLFSGAAVFLLGLSGAYFFERAGNNIWGWMFVHLAVDSIGLVNIGNFGLFRAPVGGPAAFLFGGMFLCAIITFPLARWLLPGNLTKR
jgi:membrane protease YdiL (CAAX protease family)